MKAEFSNIRVMLGATYEDSASLYEEKPVPARVQIQTLEADKSSASAYREVCIRMVVPANEAGELYEGIKTASSIELSVQGMQRAIKRAAA